MEETITWHLLPELPDTDIDVLVNSMSDRWPVWVGHYDSEMEMFSINERWFELNMILAWAEIPAGVKPNAA